VETKDGGLMTDELIKQLLEAGVHFGHQTRRWNPKMKRFIFSARNKIHIIDLQKTAEHLNIARDFLCGVAATGGTVLFVGTKKQAQGVVVDEATRCGMFYVKNRWLGGLLTNFHTIKKSIQRLRDIERMEQSGIIGNLTKKEIARIAKEKGKLLYDIGGIQDMKEIPQALIIVDTKKEEIAVREANRLGIPIVGIIDTNSNPELITYPIPANDDALKSIRFIFSKLTDSIVEGKKEYLEGQDIQIAAAEKKGSSKGKGTANTQKTMVHDTNNV
jgi:small subunit ribosomal protein S2